MKKSLFLGGFWVFSLVLVGCVTTYVSSDYKRSTDFSLLKRFAWANDQKLSGDLRFDDPDLHTAIRHSIESELQSKGLRKVVAMQPDVLLKYYIAVAQKKEVVAGPYPPVFNPRSGVVGPNTSMAQNTTTFRYEEGTFVLDMVNPGSGEILWRGTLEGMVDPGATQAQRLERVPESIARILKKFPPVKK